VATLLQPEMQKPGTDTPIQGKKEKTVIDQEKCEECGKYLDDCDCDELAVIADEGAPQFDSNRNWSNLPMAEPEDEES
jgi:TPP-dependent indolepyruvate ferredoxin oxidoreductase alpha subunit